MGRRRRSNSRSRSRSRSGGRESKKRRKERKTDRPSSKYQRKEKSVSPRSSSDDGDRWNNDLKNGSKNSDFSTTTQSGNASTGSESLSIAETNALRAKLGLTPLEIGSNAPDQKSAQQGDGKHEVLEDGVLWAPASNLTHDRKTEKIRDKLAVMKEKRDIEKNRFNNVATLGEERGNEMRASDWVARSRFIQEKQKRQEKEERQMNQLGSEFNLDSIMSSETKGKSKGSYSSSSLSGLKVEHSVDKFLEGEATVLTLKDKKILDDDNEDVLINQNIIDNDRHAQNVQNRTKGKDYQAFDDGEFDEFGMPKMQALLGKYDEVIEGEHKRSFKIGDHGEIDDEEARYRKMVKKELESKTVSLAMPEAKIALEYNTKEEDEATFAKRKRKTRKVRSTKLTADDLLGDMPSGSTDHGSRSSKSKKRERKTSDLSGDELAIDWSSMRDPVKLEDDVHIAASIVKTEEIVKNRVQKSDTAKLIAEKLNKAAKEEEIEEKKSRKLVFDNTAEFCRAVSERNKQDVKVKSEPESMKNQLDRELEEFAMRGSSDEEPMDTNNGWDNVERDNRTIGEQLGGKSKIKSAITEEPEVTAGVMGALMLAKNKGYLEKAGEKRAMGSLTQSSSKFLPEHAIEDKGAKHIEDKWSRKEDRDRGSLREFRQDHGYKPSFNLEYYDGSGRKLNEKEAFRELSHKFHGKGSGKLKTFKRMKKLEEERKLKGMSSDDTPLHMVATMRDKQKSLGSAHIILSGMGQNLTSSATDFKK